MSEVYSSCVCQVPRFTTISTRLKQEVKAGLLDIFGSMIRLVVEVVATCSNPGKYREVGIKILPNVYTEWFLVSTCFTIGPVLTNLTHIAAKTC